MVRSGVAITRFSVSVLAALLCGLPAAASTAGTVGVLMAGETAYFKSVHDAFVRELKKSAPDAELLVQTPAADAMALANAARRFEAVEASVIVAYGTAALQAVLKETRGIPVVYAAIHSRAFAPSDSRVTGIGWSVPAATVLKDLKAIRQDLVRLGVVLSPFDVDSERQAREVEALQADFGFKCQRFRVDRAADVDTIKNVDALYLTSGAAVMAAIEQVTAAGRSGKMVVAAVQGGGEASGVLLTITAASGDLGQVAAQQTARILRGDKPAAVPVAKPKNIEVVLNLKTSEALGLKVPLEVLGVATRVIK